MKVLKCILPMAALGVVLGTLPAEATLSDFSTGDGITYTGGGSSLSQVIPDNTPAGVGYAINFSATGVSISDISITLNISGGYNGDLYAYVSHGDTLVQLLNPNGAVSTSGFNNVTFGETGSSIPTGGSGSLGGNYVAYGNLSLFNGTDPNGQWTIFFADMNPGDTSTLNSFTLTITAVPEPIGMALVLFAGLVGLWWCLGVCWKMKDGQNVEPDEMNN